MPEGSDEEPEGTTVVVDVHEPDAVRYLALGHPDTDNWMEHDLEAADIVVNGVGFERKTPSDYASSVLDDRLNEQIAKLKDVYDHAYILLEGGLDDFSSLPHTAINAASLRGHAASTTARHGIPVIPTGGSTGTETAHRLLVDTAIRLGRKHTEAPVSDYLSVSSVGSDVSPGVKMWAALDGVGPERAESLTDVYGTPVDWAEDAPDLTVVDGIGSKTAESLVEQLRAVSAPSPPDDDERAQDAPEGSHDDADA